MGDRAEMPRCIDCGLHPQVPDGIGLCGPCESANAESFPRGQYATIVADPPWAYSEGFNSSTNTPGRKPSWTVHDKALPYSSMSVEEITAIPVGQLAASDCRLFLWTTNKYLPDAFSVMDAWGFRYKQTLVWHKLDGNMGGSVAPNSAEFVLVGVKGNPPRLSKASSAVLAHSQSKVHSEKPAMFSDLIESVSPPPYVELFARQPRLGWAHWGMGIENYELAAEYRTRTAGYMRDDEPLPPSAPKRTKPMPTDFDSYA